MAIGYGQDIQYSYSNTAATTTAGTGQAPDRRRTYDFTNEVKTLTPNKNPFFTYLTNVAKFPVSASVFRFLEDRTQTDWTSREFYLDTTLGAVTPGNTYTFQVDDSASGSIDWLIQGMVFTVGTVLGAAGFSLAQCRITSAPSINSADTTFQGIVEQLSNSGVANYNLLIDDDRCQVIGTSFAEGTGSPDVWSSQMEDNFGYTTICKTAFEMSNTAMAEEYRGHKSDWQWGWKKKLIEHLSDIERISLFSQKARNGNIQSTEGIVGHIIKNSTVNAGNTVFSYSSGKAYYRSLTKAELVFDRILEDLQVVNDPARSDSDDRLVLTSREVMTYLNKMGDNTFVEGSLAYSNTPWRENLDHTDGNFGHKLLSIETINGSLHFVSEPMFRGNSRSLMCWVDLDSVKYRPLVGNGMSRDTFIESNVQANDEDARKDQIITEFAIEVSIPERNCLYSIEDI